ncbi:hypothetical protein JHK85_006518 [Glycine max]|nr:hypothetical protein JHK85_006518 [Glycine max]
MEHCHASNKNAIVSSSDENACVVRPFSPEVESIDDLSDVVGMNMVSKLRERLFMLDSWFLQPDFLDMDAIGISVNGKPYSLSFPSKEELEMTDFRYQLGSFPPNV